MSEWNRLDNEIRCLGCGQSLHAEMIAPHIYGYQTCWVECQLCGHKQKIIINVLRTEPDFGSLYMKFRIKEEENDR